MKIFTAPLLWLVLAGITWLSCNKEDTPGISEGVPVNVTFAGRITNEDGIPLAGAVVSSGTASATTDGNGVFRMEAVKQPSRNAILNVRLDGFFDFSRAWFVENNAVQQVSIQLLKKQFAGSFLAAQSAIVYTGAAQISFPAGSITKPDGSAYSGIVEVYARYLDPTDPDLNERMPGDLRGISTDNGEQTLATFGMIAVEIATPAGDPLHIATGMEVEIDLPIPTEKLAVAPMEIPLWYYDVEKARWIEEGNAKKTGNRYVGKVKHFSFWNCDDSFPLINLNGKVLFGNGETPIVSGTVKLTILSTGWVGYGDTNSNGRFGGSVPKDEAMQLEILVKDICGTPSFFTQTIGPFSQDVTLPAIVIPEVNLNPLPISGRLVNCNQQAVADGYVIVTGAGPETVVFAEVDGSFQQTLVRCSLDINLTIIGYDPGAAKQSAPLTINTPPSSIQTGDISVCNTLGEFITILFKGKTFTFLPPINAVRDIDYTLMSTPDTSHSFALLFVNNGQTGTFPIVVLSIEIPGEPIHEPLGTVLITQYGSAGEMIFGFLDALAEDENGQSHSLTGSFQVIRDQ